MGPQRPPHLVLDDKEEPRVALAGLHLQRDRLGAARALDAHLVGVRVRHPNQRGVYAITRLHGHHLFG